MSSAAYRQAIREIQTLLERAACDESSADLLSPALIEDRDRELAALLRLRDRIGPRAFDAVLEELGGIRVPPPRAFRARLVRARRELPASVATPPPDAQ